MKTFRLSAMLAAVLMSSAPAFAQTMSKRNWVVSPFVGSASGDAATQSATTVGVSGGWRGNGWVGVEGDLGWTPEFFEQDGFRTERRVLTVMGNGVLNLPTGSERLRPYVSGGLGLFRPELAEAGGLFSVDASKLGWDAGGGAEFFQGHVGRPRRSPVLPWRRQERQRRQRVRPGLFEVRLLARDGRHGSEVLTGLGLGPCLPAVARRAEAGAFGRLS